MNEKHPPTANVLRAMGLLVAERCDLSPTGYRWLADPPPWAQAFGCTPQAPCDLANSFAFMDLFLEDAVAFWNQAQGPATLSSASWSEPDDVGVNHQLEAVALRLVDPDAEIVAIAGAGADFEHTQGILQAARDRRLSVDRELAMQREVEQQLRLRVEQRTAELARTNERLRAMGSQVALAEQRERHRLAVGLHDHVGQLLAAAKLRIAAERARAEDPTLTQGLTEVLDVLGQAIDATRTLTFELSPPMLYELGLVATLASLVEQMGRRHPGIDCVFRDDGDDRNPTQDVEVVLFQVIRELINNALKHAQASQLVVETRREGANMVLTVTDNGAGFNVAQLEEPVVGPGGFGLYSVREQLMHWGACLEVESAPGAGTVARVVAPLSVS
ncbi:MAG: sensor histidine kinase [Algisphaera sp.]